MTDKVLSERSRKLSHLMLAVCCAGFTGQAVRFGQALDKVGSVQGTVFIAMSVAFAGLFAAGAYFAHRGIVKNTNRDQPEP